MAAKGGMKVRQHPKKGFYVDGLRIVPVKNFKEIEDRIEEGTRRRTVAATQMNATRYECGSSEVDVWPVCCRRSTVSARRPDHAMLLRLVPGRILLSPSILFKKPKMKPAR